VTSRALVLAAVLALSVAAPASAQTSGWDGTNPFKCQLQYAGFEPVGPDPAADPYCVEFDKTRQNVTELGVVDFFSKEPERVAQAGPKCFYFQVDHWRGSVVQEDGSTKTYEWDGHYFFDKGRGLGGAHVSNFNVNGQTGDPSAVPFMPPEYAKYMAPGTGGVISHDSLAREPACAARAEAEADRIYADPRGERGTAPAAACTTPTGAVTNKGIGPVVIGDREQRVREMLGAPAEVRRGFLRYCDGAPYRVGQRSDRSGEMGSDGLEPTIMVFSTHSQHRLHGVGPGSHMRALRRQFRRTRRLGRIGDRTAWLTRRGSPVVFGVARGTVRWAAVYDRRAVHTKKGLRSLLRRAAVD
jgi:hypothetical protein